MLETFKVKTIQQFHILEFLKANFTNDTFVDIHLISRYELLVIDREGGVASVVWKSPNNIEFSKIPKR